MVYRGMDKAALDLAYSNSTAVGGPAVLQRLTTGWLERSRTLVAKSRVALDLRYGEKERERIDVFTAAEGAPTLAFIHGGYWQGQVKEVYGFLAEGPLARGINFANIEYTLAPEQGMDAIVAETRLALEWLGANLEKLGGRAGALYVAGHSAGGHLTAMALAAPHLRPTVKGGLAISGLFDLEPIRLGSLNDKIGMGEDEARRNSPLANLPEKAPPLVVAYGEKELPELCRQSKEFHQARQRKGLEGRLLPLPGHDHFTILEELAKPTGALTDVVTDLAG
jgi:acetyl esterase/lipase